MSGCRAPIVQARLFALADVVIAGAERRQHLEAAAERLRAGDQTNHQTLSVPRADQSSGAPQLAITASNNKETACFNLTRSR
jgi:hypothetical protein